GFTGLHVAAYFGVVEIVDAVLSMKEWDVNAIDNTGNTALLWAERGGCEEVLKLLLAREGVNPHTPNTICRLPLLCEVNHRHAEVVKIILEPADIHVNTPDNENETPLSLALSKGHKEVLKILQE
ncbi:ankyrin, partial [Choiromyces venosus 120613-1]